MWIELILLFASPSETFLPRGRGALILMFGGLAMLGLALAGSFATKKQRLAGPGTHARAIRAKVPAAAPRQPRRPVRREAEWVRKARLLVGGFRVLATDLDSSFVELTRCPDCAAGARGTGCGRAHRVLASAAPEHVLVREVACRAEGVSACRFEFRRRGR